LQIINKAKSYIEERERSHMLRRSGENRRKLDDPNYKGAERRRGNDRRSGMERRKSASSDIPRELNPAS
jgi:hypothetical protein